jgi:tetratricopeptide (TPR) repeat protein
MGGFLESRKDRRAARGHYERALALFESIAAADTQSVDGRIGVAISLHNIGNSRAAEGDAASALADYERARTFYEPVVAGDPSNAWAEGALADLYLNSGHVKEKMGDVEAACVFYSRAHEVFERMRVAGKLTQVRLEPSAQAAAAVDRCLGGRPQAASNAP